MEQSSFRLFVADDEETILRGVETYITKYTQCFHKVHCTLDGQEALDMIFKYHPDVMLIDVQTPVKSGLDIMREACVVGLYPKTVVPSGYDTFSYAQQVIRIGAVDYLSKPCRPFEILTKLESVAVPWMAEKVETPAGEGNLLVRTVIEYTIDHTPEDINLTMAAEKAGVPTAHFSTLFTQRVGCGFVDYLNKLRIDCACDYMHDGCLRVYEIAFKVEYHDEKHLSKVLKKITGQSPSTYGWNIGVDE